MSALELKNVTTQHTRAEEIKDRKFDFAISRAVAPLKDLWTWSKPLLRKDKSGVESRELGVGSWESAVRSQESGVENLEINDPLLTTPDSQLPTPNSRLNTHSPGLICLKGGDLATEIQQSGTRPYVTEIGKLFPEPFFEEKYLLYVPKK